MCPPFGVYDRRAVSIPRAVVLLWRLVLSGQCPPYQPSPYHSGRNIRTAKQRRKRPLLYSHNSHPQRSALPVDHAALVPLSSSSVLSFSPVISVVIIIVIVVTRHRHCRCHPSPLPLSSLLTLSSSSSITVIVIIIVVARHCRRHRHPSLSPLSSLSPVC